MKTSGYLILYISENDDFELWRALSQFSAEERAAVAKSALRTVLLQDNKTGQSQAKQHSPEKNYPDSPAADIALNELGLDLISSASDQEMFKPEKLTLVELEELLQSTEAPQPNSGLDFLLNNVIGEEDDEKVIDFIKKSRNDIDREQNNSGDKY